MKMKKSQLKNSQGYEGVRNGDGYACEKNESGPDETCHYPVCVQGGDHL